jgi:hypothetical protein
MRDLNQVLGGYVAPGPVHAYPAPIEYRPVVLATPPAPAPVYMLPPAPPRPQSNRGFAYNRPGARGDDPDRRAMGARTTAA